MDSAWVNNSEHDHLYGISSELTATLRQEFDVPDLRVQCGFEARVGYHFLLHGVDYRLIGKIADRARDWLASETPYRFELRVQEI